MKQIIQTNYSGIDGLKIVDKPKPAVSPLSALVQVKYTPVLRLRAWFRQWVCYATDIW